MGLEDRSCQAGFRWEKEQGQGQEQKQKQKQKQEQEQEQEQEQKQKREVEQLVYKKKIPVAMEAIPRLNLSFRLAVVNNQA